MTTDKQNLHPNRDSWWHAVLPYLAEDFHRAGYTLPDKIKVATGNPDAGSASSRRGAAYSPDLSVGQFWEIFIDIGIAEPIAAMIVLMAQLIFTVLPIVENGFPKGYRKLMTLVGLHGDRENPEATPALEFRLNTITASVGPMPHKAVHARAHHLAEAAKRKALGAPKTQTARMLGAKCAVCGYAIRIAQKHIDVGLPSCPKDQVQLTLDKPVRVSPGNEDAAPAAAVSDTVSSPILSAFTTEVMPAMLSETQDTLMPQENTTEGTETPPIAGTRNHEPAAQPDAGGGPRNSNAVFSLGDQIASASPSAVHETRVSRENATRWTAILPKASASFLAKFGNYPLQSADHKLWEGDIGSLPPGFADAVANLGGTLTYE